MKNTRSVASVSEGSFFILTPCMLLLLLENAAWYNITTWSDCCYNHINVEETSKNNNLPESSRGLASFISTSESASCLSSGFSLSSSCCVKQEHRLVIIWWIIYLLHAEPSGHISTIVPARWDEPFVELCICTQHGIAYLVELHFFSFVLHYSTFGCCFSWLHFIGWILYCRTVLFMFRASCFFFLLLLSISRCL